MLNHLLNLFWTVGSFSMVGFYWGIYLAEKRAPAIPVAIIVLSILFYKVPRKLLAALTLSDNLRTYEQFGVKFLLWFVQNGTLVNRIQQKSGSYQRIITTRKKALTYIGTINMQERYHYSCFVLFMLSAISAALIGKIEFAFYITFWNIAYNIYPILLQQYNRLRIKLILSGSGAQMTPKNK